MIKTLSHQGERFFCKNGIQMMHHLKIADLSVKVWQLIDFVKMCTSLSNAPVYDLNTI